MNNLKTIFHIGLACYPDLKSDFGTKRIWQELSRDVDHYVVIARSKTNHYQRFRERKIDLFLVPKLVQPLYLVTGLLVVKLAKYWQPDLIIVQEPIIGGTLARICRLVCRAKVLMEIHSEAYFYWQNSLNPYHRLLAWIAFTNFRSADHVRSLTQGFSHQLIKAGVAKNKLTVISNRVELNLFDRDSVNRREIRKQYQIDPKDIVFVSTGRLTADKNHLLLLKAFENVQTRIPDTHLVIIGEGQLKNKYQEWITKHSLTKKVTLTGRISPKEVAQILGAASIYVHPSNLGTEALPRAILEAMACQLPVIATRVAAVPEILDDGKLGVLIPPNNKEILAAQMLRLASSLSLRQHFSQVAYRAVRERHDWQPVFQSYRQLLRKVVGQK